MKELVAQTYLKFEQRRKVSDAEQADLGEIGSIDSVVEQVSLYEIETIEQTLKKR